MDKKKTVRKNLSELVRKSVVQLGQNDDPQWGIMSPQHMIEHLSLQFAIAHGKINIEVFDKKQAERYKRRLFDEDWSFPKNFRVPGIPRDRTPNLRFESLDRAKEVLLQEMDHFFEYFERNPEDQTPHPMLGPLSYREWLRFHLLHCRHHFEQFNLISSGDSNAE